MGAGHNAPWELTAHHRNPVLDANEAIFQSQTDTLQNLQFLLPTRCATVVDDAIQTPVSPAQVVNTIGHCISFPVEPVLEAAPDEWPIELNGNIRLVLPIGQEFRFSRAFHLTAKQSECAC